MSRIAILVEQNWNAVPGGTARSANRLIEALLDHTDVDIAGVHGAHRSAPVLPLPTRLNITEIPIPGKILAESWSRFDRVSIDRFVTADVVHSPAYVMPKSNAAQVVTIHDLAFARHPEWFTANGVRYFNRFLDRVKESDAVVIAPSATTANDCVTRGIEPSRVHVISWGIDSKEATEEQIDDVRRRYALPDTFVLFVGTVEPRKNVTTLIEAMESISNVPLVVVGPTGWGNVRAGDATVLGDVPDTDIAPLMAAAAVLAYPSHFEGFGLPVLEAMAQGTPVLVTERTAPAELAARGGIAINTRSVDTITSTLRDLLDSDTERSVLGAAGKVRSAEFRWDLAAKAHAAIYERLS